MDKTRTRIKELRLAKGMTLEEVGNAVGVGKSIVRKWENGIIQNMKRDKIANLAKALDVSPSYLMGWDDPEPTPAAEAGTVLGKAARDPNQIKLLGNYQQLNDEGQKEILNHMDYVISQEKYKNL